jgi:hypothetical protein
MAVVSRVSSILTASGRVVTEATARWRVLGNIAAPDGLVG